MQPGQRAGHRGRAAVARVRYPAVLGVVVSQRHTAATFQRIAVTEALAVEAHGREHGVVEDPFHHVCVTRRRLSNSSIRQPNMAAAMLAQVSL